MERNTFTAEQEKWLLALESGEYEQGFGRLKVDDKYCCLGVLALQHDHVLEGTGVYSWLRDKMHMRSGEARMRDAIDGASCLTGLNDSGSWPFSRIAAFIRANPYQVFTNFDAPGEPATGGRGD